MRYFAIPPVTHAQSAPGVSLSFDGVGAQLYLSPSGAGPTNEDFQVKVCFYDTLDSNGWGPACVTSPWASEAGTSSGVWTDESGTNVNGAPGPLVATTNTGNWSYWVWPGHSDEMGSATISVVNTRPLPAGKVLSNVQLGIELAEDNGGELVGTNTNLQADSCIQQFTPIGGGTSPTAYSYTYGDNCSKSPSGSPDAFRFYLGSTIGTRSVAMSSNIPAQMNPGATGSYAITVKNTGNVPFVPTKWTFVASGPGTGNCDIDTDGDGVKDAPNPSSAAYRWTPGSPIPPPTYTCTVTGTATASDLLLTHAGSLITPTTTQYAITNVTKTTSFTPGYTIQLDNSNPTTPVALSTTQNPLASLIPVAHAIPLTKTGSGFPATLFVKPQTVVSYSQPLEIPIGGTGTFTVPLTAPQASGQYSETWTFSDPLTATVGPVAGGTYTIPITVGTPTPTLPIYVTSHLASSTKPVPASFVLFGQGLSVNVPTSSMETSGEYQGVPNANYTISNVTTTVPGLSLRDVIPLDLAEAHRNMLGGLLAVLNEPLGEIAHAQTVTATFGNPPQTYPMPSATLLAPSLTFDIIWNGTPGTGGPTSTPPGGPQSYACSTNGACVASPVGAYTNANCNNACGNINKNPTSTPPGTGTGGATSCTSFMASSTTIVPGEKSTLSWSCSAGPCSIDNGVGGVNPSGSSAVNPTTTTVYTLTCTGVSTTTTVIVQNPSQKEVNP